MKRLAIFVGGLLVLPAFAEVAPIFIDENGAIEYADEMYDENGFLINPETEVIESEDDVVAQQTPVKVSRAPVNATPGANRTTSTRAVPTSGSATASGRGTAAGNSSRVVAARTTTSPRGDASRTVASRGTTATSPRTTGAATSTRATATTAATRAAATRATGGASRTATSNGATVARTGTTTRAGTTSARTTAARTATTAAGTARAATTTDGAARPSIRTNDFGPGAKTATITASSDGVKLTGGTDPLYLSNKSASVRRTPTIRMSSLNGLSTETTAVSVDLTTEDLDGIAELTDYCKAQYANCMDNYCNVLDDNQGRCSCSANLKNYAKAEAALKTATEELQDVAQKIQYIGLSRREVETLFTETEAEETMRTKGTDNSQLQASLNKVKDMIINVQSGGATTSTSDDILNFDLSGLLEFSFDSTGFDLASLFGTSNTNSVNNQRGEQLYKTAAARCKSSVLKACTAKGVDASLITNAYDLEIDRECMAYERSLNDSNDQMVATVRNAKNVLQKARLMVAQQKNTYDMRGCINALDACMQDEFVCGSDYENCLDPTGRYIVNGAIVVGSQPGHAIDPDLSQNVASVMTSDVCRVNLYRTWDMPDATCAAHKVNGEYSTYIEYPTADQGNAWGSGGGDNLVAYIENTVEGTYPDKASENMSLYLQNKIGYNKDGKNYGMCMSVLNKCQDYTYSGTGTSAKYDPKNDVIKQYLGRILVQIKAKQDEVLANYAETCVSDVTSCLGQNGYPSEDPADWDPSEYSTNTTKMNIAVNACRAQIVTCMSVNGYSIDTPTPTEMNCWVQGLLYSTSTDECMIDNIHDNPCSLETISQCTQGTCKATLGPSYTWCTTGDIPSCMLESQCPTPKYNVIINCGDHGEFTGSDAQPVYPISSGSSISLNWSTYCTPKDSDWKFDYWKCGTSNTHLINDYQYTPSTNNVGCTVYWKTTNPATTTYKLNIDCGNGGGFTGGTVGNNCIASGSCGQVSVISGACTNLNDFCFWPTFQSGTIPWSCNGDSLTNNDRMCPVSDGITCTANNQPSGGKKLTINCGAGTTGTNTTINLPSNNCISISSLSSYCSATNSDVEITWNCNGVVSGASQRCFNNVDNPLCTATADGGTQNPSWVTVNLKYGTVTPTRYANPDKLFVDKNNVCTAVYRTAGQASSCPQESITQITTPKANNFDFGGFVYNDGETVYIRYDGQIRTSALHDFIGAQEQNSVDLTAKWLKVPDYPDDPDGPSPKKLTINNQGGSRIGEMGSVTEFYVSNKCTGGNTVSVYRLDPETYPAVCNGSPVTNIGQLVKSGTRASGFFVDVDGNETVQFAKENGDIISENLSKLGTASDRNLTATAKFFDASTQYILFNKDYGTWERIINPPVASYDINNDINIYIYPNKGTNTPWNPIRYVAGLGYASSPDTNYFIQNYQLTNFSWNNHTIRGLYPKRFDVVSRNTSGQGKPWPDVFTDGGVKLPSDWVLITPHGESTDRLDLYAAWAENCEPSGYATCSLEIDAGGNVTYTTSCNDNTFILAGNGTNIPKCTAPGSNEDFEFVFLPGATVAATTQAN